METIKNLAIDSQLIKDSEGTGIMYTFKSEKDCAAALKAAYEEKLEVSGGSPNSLYIWH